MSDADNMLWTLWDGPSGKIYCRDVDRTTAQRVMNSMTLTEAKNVMQAFTYAKTAPHE